MTRPPAAGLWPLTEAQEGLWFAQRLDPSNPLFNTGHYLALHGPLDLDAWRTATAQVMAEAEALSLRMADQPEGPRQWRVAGGAPALEIIDLSAEKNPADAARARMAADMNMPVDPTRDPLARQILFVLGPLDHYWYLRVHHLAADGYGMGLIEHRLAQCYAHACGDGVAGEPLAPLAPVMDEDAAYRADARRTRDRDYWLAELADPPPAAELVEGPAASAHTALRAALALPPTLADALHARCAREDLAWPDVLTALAAAYLSRHIPQQPAVYGVPFMGRLGSASARVPCTVMNVAPLRLAVDDTQPLTDYFDQVSRQLRQIRRHGRYRSEQLRRDLGLLGGRRRLYGPLINVLPLDTPADLRGLTVQRHVLGTGPVDDLTVTFRAGRDDRDLWLELEANPQRYAPAAVQAHLTRLHAFLAAALTAERLQDVPTLTAEETRHWIDGCNDTAHEVPDVSLWDLLHDALRGHADRIAVVDDEASLRYDELARASGALAARLAAMGAGPGTRVAVALPRGCALPVALLAILRCGAAYLPLDLDHPAARIDRLLDAAQPALLLGQADTLAAWAHAAPALPRLSLDTLTLDGDAAPSTLPTPADAAYVLYTSGSTGAPKGVVVSHRAIVNRLLWMQAHYGIDAHARILQKTPYTFDVSVWEFFLPLISGATLVMAPPQSHRDPAWLVRLIRDHAIDTLHFVPSMLAAFLDEAPPADLPIRQVFCSGEALPASLRDRFHTLLNAALHNLYGPTEAAVDVSWWPASAQDDSQPVPIGYPVWNTSLFVLDGAARPVPPGVPGRLYIAGRQLADGYLGQPALTAERFLPCPWPQHGPRMYDTGDLAQWRDDGALLFLGRRDDQIKLRGQRIEPGEIEAVLAQAPGVLQVAVLALKGADGHDYLAAYLQGQAGASLSDAALREHARAHLPDAMVPSAWVVLDDWPVTANGKLDRRALPTPSHAPAAGQGRAPATPAEQAIAEAFTDVLGLSTLVCADDDFFELGGHSLLAAQLARRLRDVLSADVSIGTLFEHATPARLARWADTAGQPGDNSGFGPSIVLRTGEPQRPALFCIHPAGGISWSYGGLARALTGPSRTVYGVQARSLEPGQPAPSSLAGMAADYVDLITTLQPEGPYHLLGWSVGGIIAHAMACELQTRGQRTGVLAMLDAYPSDRWRTQPEPAPDAVYKALLHIAGHDPATLPDVPLTRDGVIGFLRTQQHPLAALSDERLLGVIRAVEQNNRLVRSHHHTRYEGQALYFRAALDHAGQDLHPEDWLPYVAALETHDVPALHAHLTGTAASAHIAPRVAALLQEHDS